MTNQIELYLSFLKGVVMRIIIRFSNIPEELCFEVGCRTEYANAVKEAWHYAGDSLDELSCLVRCPGNLPNAWEPVPGLLVPGSKGRIVDVYRQWPNIVDFAKRLNDLSEIVEESKYLDGIVEWPEGDVTKKPQDVLSRLYLIK